MTAVLLVLVVASGLFGFVLVFGAPYLPTLSAQQKQALDMLALKPGQVFYDLGSGDGRMLTAAAQRGLMAVGYELNPLLVVYSWLVTRHYGKNVRIVWGNFWKADLSQTDGVFVFLLDRFMPRLDRFLLSQNRHGELKVVSYTFAIPGKKAAAKKGPIYLYKY